MAIITKDGFDFYDDINGNIDAFILKGENLDSEIAYIIKQKINSIALNYFDSKSVENLKSIEGLDFIEKISIDNLDISYEELYSLINLKEISVNVKNKKQYLDYSQFSKLENLSIDWYNNFPDLSKNENLKELSVWKFKPKSKSLAELSLPKKIEKLHITESNILSLEGLELDGLKEFEGHYCKSLETLKGIEKFNNNLNVLILDYCKKLTSYENLKYAKNLKKLILGDCGDIPNIKWLKDLRKIKHFSFWNTKLVDGDTSFCFGIDYVSFKNLKHYNYRQEEINTGKYVPQNRSEKPYDLSKFPIAE